MKACMICNEFTPVLSAKRMETMCLKCYGWYTKARSNAEKKTNSFAIFAIHRILEIVA